VAHSSADRANAIRLHREIGFKKTTVADIARGASMSPANVYRFFPSKQAIEEAVAADLFEQVSAAATLAARGGGSVLERLRAALRAISQLHDNRLANDSKLHELLAATIREKRRSPCPTRTGSRCRAVDHRGWTGERRGSTRLSDGADLLPA